jgi:hypothetical protein
MDHDVPTSFDTSLRRIGFTITIYSLGSIVRMEKKNEKNIATNVFIIMGVVALPDVLISRP